MRHLLSFQFDSLVLTDPPPLTAKWGSHSLLHYFSLKQKDAVPWSSFRVVVVGPKSGGKTTLLTKLRGEGAVSIAPTKGLEVGQHESPKFNQPLHTLLDYKSTLHDLHPI